MIKVLKNVLGDQGLAVFGALGMPDDADSFVMKSGGVQRN
jgi:hypothetical protein